MSNIQFWLFAAILLPIFAFTAIGLLGPLGDDAQDQREDIRVTTSAFFYADQRIPSGQYSQSAAAYMFQAGVTFYFIYYGYHYGLGNIFYLFCWGLGLYLFAGAAPQLLIHRDKKEGLPDIIAQGNPILRALVALIAIITFLGIFYVETVFVSDMTTKVVEYPTSDLVWWAVFIIISVSVYVYSTIGGQRKVILTDVYQLSTAYFGLSIALAYLVVRAAATDPLAATLIGLFLVLLYGYLFYFYTMLVTRNAYSVITVFISCGLTVLCTAFALSAYMKGTQAHSTVPGLFSPFSDPLGWVTVLGFCVLNSLVQFGDYSNYQRNIALDLTSQSEPSDHLGFSGCPWQYALIKANFTYLDTACRRVFCRLSIYHYHSSFG